MNKPIVMKKRIADRPRGRRALRVRGSRVKESIQAWEARIRTARSQSASTRAPSPLPPVPKNTVQPVTMTLAQEVDFCRCLACHGGTDEERLWTNWPRFAEVVSEF